MSDQDVRWKPRVRWVWRPWWGDFSQATRRTLWRLGWILPPLRLNLDITDHCNLRCPTCSKWRVEPGRAELKLEEWEQALSKLEGRTVLRELVISGGEPFSRADVFDILAAAKRRHFRTTVISSGWSLDAAVLQRLQEIGLDLLTVSLNSLHAGVHDPTRGVAGSHERILRFIRLWQGEPRRTGLSLSTVVMSPNAGELADLAAFAWDGHLNGISLQALAPPQAHYAFAAGSVPEADADWPAQDPLWVRDVATLEAQVQRLLTMQAQGAPIVNPPGHLRRMVDYYAQPETVSAWPCLGTSSRLYVDPCGDLRLCYGFPPLGNILHDDPIVLWRGSAAASIRRASRTCTRPCRMLNNNL